MRYRLLYKAQNMSRVFWVESDNLHELRIKRIQLLSWAIHSEISWVLSPYILDITKSETVLTRE